MTTLLELIPYMTIFLFGIIIGSFLNVCIYRIPLEESVVVTRSHCMTCGYQLRWYDLIPVFSFLFLRGRCRKCKEKISFQYPLIEAANGILYVTLFFMNGWNILSVLYCLMASALLTLSVIDFRTCEIPAGINGFILVLGVLRILLDLPGWYTYVIGGLCVSGFLLCLFAATKGRAIGGGDVKLMAVCGLLLGWKLIILAFIAGCVFGSVIHSIRMKVCKAGRMLAMGPYLSAGILLAVLWGEQWINWYLLLFQ